MGCLCYPRQSYPHGISPCLTQKQCYRSLTCMIVICEVRCTLWQKQCLASERTSTKNKVFRGFFQPRPVQQHALQRKAGPTYTKLLPCSKSCLRGCQQTNVWRRWAHRKSADVHTRTLARFYGFSYLSTKGSHTDYLKEQHHMLRGWQNSWTQQMLILISYLLTGPHGRAH
jgi:hypothetical protein